MAPAMTALDRTAVETAAARVMARADRLARISAAPGRIERTYLTPEHARANRCVAGWMREAGMTASQDAAGNLAGHSSGREPDAPVLLLGSHLDTVPDAGRYDGIVGVLMAIEVVTLLRRTGHLAGLPFGVDVVAFWDEEGTRFGKAMLGSSAVGGVWDPTCWDLTDASGTSLREAFTGFGLDPARIGEAARRPGDVVAYLEAHIEQGPRLDQAGLPLAVVSSVAGARRFEIEVLGEARHAGGTPYESRHDALLGASEIVVAVEALCRAERHVIGTVGRLETPSGAVNVIPGEVRFSLDLRGELDDTRDGVWGRISSALDEIAGRRGLRWSARELHTAGAVACAPGLVDVLRAGIETGTGERDAPALFSPAGHDAMAVAAITDVGMLFLRNADGISHHPAESVTRDDVARGLEALTAAVVHLGAG